MSSTYQQPALSARRDTPLLFARPDIDELEVQAVSKVLRSGWITTGSEVRNFEAEFARSVGAKHAVAVNSCTAALHLALEAIGLKAGDEVITTPYTFTATAEVIRYFNAKPVFVDVEADTLNLDWRRVEGAISSRTKAIIPVHIGGLPAKLREIQRIALRHGLPTIEDAAHAFPASCHGQRIGSVSEVTCFSFYATKCLTTGEGGMLCTDDDSIAKRARIMALHGISKDAYRRYASNGSWFYQVVAPGFKYNLTDIAAAIGRVQLSKADAMRARRKQIATSYDEAFAAEETLQTPTDDPDCQHAWHLYMLRLNLDRLRIDRSEFIEQLRECGICTSVHFIPLHIHPYYEEAYGFAPEDYPVAYGEYLREVSLPIYSSMTDSDVDDVIGTELEAVDRNRK